MPRSRVLSWLWAILRQRCPRCYRGPVFRGLFAMHDPCPHCGQIFQREEGYFLGAMYVSSVLGCGLIALGYFVTRLLLPEVDPFTVCLWLLLAYLPLMPLIFRYSRIIWLHLDYLVSPTNVSAGIYEKLREQQLSHPDATLPETSPDRTLRD